MIVYGIFARLDEYEPDELYGLFHKEEDANKCAEEMKQEYNEDYKDSQYFDVRVYELKVK
jgi:hypothetical protein